MTSQISRSTPHLEAIYPHQEKPIPKINLGLIEKSHAIVQLNPENIITNLIGSTSLNEPLFKVFFEKDALKSIHIREIFKEISDEQLRNVDKTKITAIETNLEKENFKLFFTYLKLYDLFIVYIERLSEGKPSSLSPSILKKQDIGPGCCFHPYVKKT